MGFFCYRSALKNIEISKKGIMAGITPIKKTPASAADQTARRRSSRAGPVGLRPLSCCYYNKKMPEFSSGILKGMCYKPSCRKDIITKKASPPQGG